MLRLLFKPTTITMLVLGFLIYSAANGGFGKFTSFGDQSRLAQVMEQNNLS